MMLTNWIRIIRKDNLTYTDQSLLNDSEATSINSDIVAAEDAIYIGKTYPFNMIYTWVDVPNALSSVMKVQYWANTEWVDAVDLLDGTSSGGKTLAQSGTIQFSPLKEKTWTQVLDTSKVDINTPTDLNGFTIYNLYWLKITFNNDLTLTSKIKRIFYLFSNEETLEGLDVDVPSYLDAFPGQTDFTRQLFLASKQTLTSLKTLGIVLNEGNLLRLEDVYMSTAWRALALIYFSLGKDYIAERTEALKMATEAINVTKFSIDTNQNAFLEDQEIDALGGGIVRI